MICGSNNPVETMSPLVFAGADVSVGNATNVSRSDDNTSIMTAIITNALEMNL